MCKKRFSLESERFNGGTDLLTREQILRILNAYNESYGHIKDHETNELIKHCDVVDKLNELDDKIKRLTAEIEPYNNRMRFKPLPDSNVVLDALYDEYISRDTAFEILYNDHVVLLKAYEDTWDIMSRFGYDYHIWKEFELQQLIDLLSGELGIEVEFNESEGYWRFTKGTENLLEENEELKIENKELAKEVEEQSNRKWACIETARLLDIENEALKKENKELKKKVDDKEVAVEVETETYMKRVFDLIDYKIDELEKRYKFGQEVYQGCPMHNIVFGINTLKELKKELEE